MNPTPTPNSDPLGPKLDGRAALERSLEKLDSPSPQPVDIARLRELLAKATPGHWFEHWFRSHIPVSKSDADLIAALRNEAPALLDELETLRMRDYVGKKNTERLERERDKLREEVAELRPKLTRECENHDFAKRHIDRIEAENGTLIADRSLLRATNTGLMSDKAKLLIERDSLRQQNEQLLKEIEGLKANQKESQ